MTKLGILTSTVAALLVAAVVPAPAQPPNTEGSNILVVAKSGGDFASVQGALNSIHDASADNPYLIYVAPGVFKEQVVMKPFVDIEGAGRDLTRITWNGRYTVFGALAGLRSLTVECERSKGTCRAIVVGDDGSPAISQVDVRASAPVATGIDAKRPFGLTLQDVTVTVEPMFGSSPAACFGLGVGHEHCEAVGDETNPSVQMSNVTIRVNNDRCVNRGISTCFWDSLRLADASIAVDGRYAYGIDFTGYQADLSQVEVVAEPFAVRGESGTVAVRHSKILGGIGAQHGEIRIAFSEFVGRVLPLMGGRTACFATCGEDMQELNKKCRPSP